MTEHHIEKTAFETYLDKIKRYSGAIINPRLDMLHNELADCQATIISLQNDRRLRFVPEHLVKRLGTDLIGIERSLAAKIALAPKETEYQQPSPYF